MLSAGCPIPGAQYPVTGIPDLADSSFSTRHSALMNYNFEVMPAIVLDSFYPLASNNF